ALKKLAREEEKANTISKKEIQEWQAALTALLTGCSNAKPLAVFFEDAQWMDADSKALLEILSLEISNRPLLFLLALRSKDDKKKNEEIIELAPLTKEETRSMVAEILTSGLAEVIYEQSSGSPLFVEEISRWIKRAYSINENQLREILQSSDVLQSMALSRFESLPEGQREVARVASAIGMEFSNVEIKALMDIDPATLHEALNALKDAGLIALLRSKITEQDYAFSQPLFRDVLYASLPFERRLELHAAFSEYLAQAAVRRKSKDKIAGFFEETTNANPLRDAERLAYHYEMSEQWLEAARQNLKAAESAQSAEESEALYLRALSLLEKDNGGNGSEKARAHLALGNIALQRLDLPAATAAHEAALSALPAEEARSAMGANLTARLCMLLPSQGKAEIAENLVKTLLAQKEVDWRTFALAAWLEWRAGRGVSSYLKECLARLTDSAPDPNPRGLAWIDDLGGNPAQAVEKYQFLNETTLEALAWIQWGNQALQEKRPGEASEKYEKAARLWKDVDFCGLALSRYRQAEACLQARDRKGAYKSLNDALLLLEKSPAVLQAQPRAAIQQALTQLHNKNYSAWKAPRWQPFDDLGRIRFLFPLFA
ncbi:MAG: hypothetical protein LDL51_10870, partial [Chloroflexi bacterium]|nr:hypothetical protein [Chloroflexota bacterium]